MTWRWLGSAVLVALVACDRGADDDDAPVVELSAAAQPIFDLMTWTDDATPPNCADAAGLSGIDAPADSAAIEAAATLLAGDVLEEIEIDPLEGSIRVRTVEREILPGPDLTDTQALVDGVTAVASAMGARADQLELEVDGVMVTGGVEGEEPTSEMVAKTVVANRRVLGQHIGDSVRATFEVQGPLISMSGTWRRFDYDASTLCVEGIEHETQVMAALAEWLAADGFVIEPTTTGFDVEVGYRPIEPALATSDTWTLRIVGFAALIDSRGGSIPLYEYYLDDGVSLAE